jgi:hypothetical protein
MAGPGTLVEARMHALGPNDDGPVHAPPAGLLLVREYVGPGGPLTVAQPESLRATWVGGGDHGALDVPWGTLDSIDDAGAYRRLADGVHSSDDSAFCLTVRLVGTSVRTSKRWLEIDVDHGGPHYEVHRGVVRGARLERDGELVAKGLRRSSLEVSSSATALDARLVAAYSATLWKMLALPRLPEFEIPGD